MPYLEHLVPKASVVTVGTTPVRLTTVSTSVACYNFLLQAGSANTGIVFIGTSATQNIGLDPEEGFSALDIMGAKDSKMYDLSQWWVRGSAASQQVNILQTVLYRQTTGAV